MTVQSLILELERAIDSAEWAAQPASALEEQGARAYGGLGDSWSFLVVTYPTDAGLRAAGTATRGPQIVWLTPALAERAAELAQRERSGR